MNDITKVGETLNAKETMTSLVIAEATGKEHKSVMRDIRILSEQVTEKDGYTFVPVSYTDAYNRQQPMYSLASFASWKLVKKHQLLLNRPLMQPLPDRTTARPRFFNGRHCCGNTIQN